MLAIPIGLLAIAAVPEPAIQHRTEPQSDGGASVFRVFRENPTLFVIYGLMFFGNILLYAIVIFLPQLLESFGISSTFRIGLFITAMTASAGATAFIYGKIRSRFSYRVIVTIAVALWAVAFTTISQASGSRIIAMAVALFGVSQGLILPTVMVWIGDVVPASFRGRFSSYLGTFGFIGQFLSPILFAPVFMLVGLKGVFMVGAGVGAAWFLILFFGAGKSHKINSARKGG
jgi:MFS family permease